MDYICHITFKHISLAVNIHLVSSIPPFSSLPRALCSSGRLLQQSGDNVIRNVEELFVNLLILTEIVIAVGEEVRGRGHFLNTNVRRALNIIWFCYWVTRQSEAQGAAGDQWKNSRSVENCSSVIAV